MNEKRRARAAARAEKKSARERAFQEQCAALEAAGYAVRDRSVSVGRANWQGLLTALPFAAAAIVCGALLSGWKFSLVGKFWADALLFAASVFVSIPVHEGLHALFWGAANGTFKGLSFGISCGSPYCACGVPMNRAKYLIGVLAPFAILGAAVSVWGLCVQNGILLALGVFNILCAGGDLLIAAKALFCRAKLLLDHPSRCGFCAFYPSAAGEQSAFPETDGKTDE